MALSDDPRELRRLLGQRLRSLSAAGVAQLPLGRRPAPATGVHAAPPALPAAVPAAQPAARSPTEPPDSGRATGPPALPIAAAHEIGTPAVAGAATLEALQVAVAACTQCGELAAKRTQTVFGTGSPRARLCFLGEAPGADEDRQGEPFVGAAGQLLNKILEACRLRREDVYILNVLKCRPPGNRNPTREEACNCRPFLDRQLELIAPEFLCCLGAVAAQNLLDTVQPIGRLRGQTFDYRGIKVVCTYHPAYLLRNPSSKKDAWEDMKRLMRLMGRPVD
jgi:DNA polymerase